MPIQIQEINDENGSMECPLCMEPLEVDDINFFPCVCGYQVCRFCWHRIRTDENGLCPACRTSYPENPVEFRPLTESDLQKIRQEKRQKEVQRRQKITDCRRHLAAIRVLQKNLVFVVGLSQRLSESEVLKRQDYFGKYGKILKIVVNTNTAYAGSQGPSASAYITYSKMEEALRAIQSVNNIHVDGRTLKASLGTTKYCSTYLKNQQCHKQDCMYLHELADEESSFTKEDMQAGKHQELEQRLIEEVARKEDEVHTEPTASTETSNSTAKSEKAVPIPRNQSSPWTAQQQQSNSKIENSWLAGMPQTFDQGMTNKPSQTEAKTKELKNSPKAKPKKLSPRHVNKSMTPTIETTDSSHASSECSSVATTPPPCPPVMNVNTQNQNTRLPNNFEEEETPETVNAEPQSQPILEAAVTDVPPPTTKQDDPVILTQTNERYIQANVKSTPSDGEFPSTTFLPPAYDIATVQREPVEPVSQPLPDAIPIQSTNDWEAAFGFGKSAVPQPPVPQQPELVADNGDNDFGFDPWVECSKGLADLMEKESASYSTPFLPPATHKPDFSRPFSTQFHAPTPKFTHTTPEQPTNHYGMKLSGFPGGFSQNLPQHQTLGSPMHHGFHKSASFDASLNSKTNFPPTGSPTKKLSDWQNGLRALLPSVNINFAMENQNSNQTAGRNPAHNIHQNDHMSAGVRHLTPRNHFNSGQQLLGSGFDEPSNPIQSHSSFFPQNFDRNQSYFHNRVGLGSALNDRYNSLAPPPGLSSSAFHSDPAIISSGTKANSAPKQTPVEEAPHWMRSLQMLVDTDTPVNQPPNLPHTNPNPSFSSWPSLPNSGAPLGGATQPPPGFQNHLTENNTMDYAIRQSLLENQS